MLWHISVVIINFISFCVVKKKLAKISKWSNHSETSNCFGTCTIKICFCFVLSCWYFFLLLFFFSHKMFISCFIFVVSPFYSEWLMLCIFNTIFSVFNPFSFLVIFNCYCVYSYAFTIVVLVYLLTFSLLSTTVIAFT